MLLLPVILGGMDECAASTARILFEAHKEKSGNLLHLLEFGPRSEDWLRETKTSIASFRKSLKSRGVLHEPLLVLLSTAFNPLSVERLALLEGMSRMLGTLMPGSQSIVLIVLFPSPTASDTEKRNTFHFFLRLEAVLWEVPFLNLVFVNQVSPEFLETGRIGALQANGLLELIYRQVLDHDLEHTIHGMGAKAVENRLTVAKRKSCYSTSGAHRLVYPKAQCFDYLASRFQLEVLELGLMNTSEVKRQIDELEKIKERVDSLVSAQCDKINSQIPEAEPVEAPPEEFLDKDSAGTPNGHLERQLKERVEKAESKIEETCLSMTQAMKDHFSDFLSNSPGHLAGGMIYGEVLLGKEPVPARTKNRERLLGVDLFQELMCRAPLVQDLELFFKPHAGRMGLAIGGESDAKSEAPATEGFVEAMKGRNAAHSSDSGGEDLFQSQSAELFTTCLSEERLDFHSSKRLKDSLLAIYRSHTKRLQEMAEERRSERETTTKDGKRYEQDLGFWRRTVSKRKAVRERREFDKKRIEALDRQIETLNKSIKAIQVLIVELLNRVILPHTIRAMLNQAFWEAAKALVEEFFLYVSVIQRTLRAGVTDPSEFRTPTASSILNPDLLGILYKMVLKESGFSEHADRLLKYVPGGLSDMEKEDLPYRGCDSLKDHFREGPISLLERLKDFTKEQIRALRRLNILDLIELLGRDAAYRKVKDTVTGLGTFLEFSPGLVPLVRTEEKLNSILTIRSDKEINARLSEEYRDAFDVETIFMDTNDLEAIDFTYMLFGFPAFVIHGLCECRELFLRDHADDPSDLWPVRLDSNASERGLPGVRNDDRRHS